jgi:hypothetical protein
MFVFDNFVAVSVEFLHLYFENSWKMTLEIQRSHLNADATVVFPTKLSKWKMGLCHQENPLFYRFTLFFSVCIGKTVMAKLLMKGVALFVVLGTVQCSWNH